MFGLTEKITGIIGGAMAFVLLLSVAWGTRVNHLRAEHKEVVDAVAEQLEQAGFKPVTKSRMAADVQYLATAVRTNRKSLEDALAEIARRNTDAEARAKAFEAAKQRVATTEAKLDKLAAGEAERQAMLDGIRQHEEATGTCAVNPGLIEAAEGL